MAHLQVQNTGFIVDTPGTCPCCLHAIEPLLRHTSATGGLQDPKTIVEAVYQCVRPQCARLFIARHANRGQTPGSTTYREVSALVPVPVARVEVPPDVRALSPSFVAIHEQAMAAEALGLDQLSGMGHRKALEFLVKDYCIHKKPGDKINIEKIQLGPCIENYVDDERVKQCAKRATWLGNDETHYLRKWTDKDLQDLKALLRVTVAWIESDLLTEKYLNEMRP